MLKIKANANLFYDWKDLGKRVELLNTIVQNDMEIPEEEANKWYRQVNSCITAIEQLRDKTVAYIKIFNRE